MQLPAVAVEELFEGEAVAGDVRCQQLGVAALSGVSVPNLRGAHPPDSSQSPEGGHFTRSGRVRTWLAR